MSDLAKSPFMRPGQVRMTGSTLSGEREGR